MMAAVTAASDGARVILLEHKTGSEKDPVHRNGDVISQTHIRNHCVIIRKIHSSHGGSLKNSTAQKAISFFLQLGVYSKNRNGYIYPNSDQASAVLDAFRMELERLQVEIRTGVSIRRSIPGKTAS